MKTGAIITRASVFLLLGAIANVAVAWACDLATESASSSITYSAITIRPTAPVWFYLTSTRPGLTSVERVAIDNTYAGAVSMYRFLGDHGVAMQSGVQGNSPPRWSRAFSTKPVPERDGRDPLIELASGWPLLSVRCDYVATSISQIDRLRGGIVFSTPSAAASRVLPFQPIWPGFAINTLFYAVVLWGLFAAPFALRRRRRIKRGLCPKCAYPIGDSPVCTECGAAIQSRGIDGMAATSRTASR